MSFEVVSGQIVASFGRHCVVETEQRVRYLCTSRGKRNDYVCGDYVQIQPENDQQAVIETLKERSSLLYRQDAHKSKLIAANIDQVMLVFAPRPQPNEYLLQCGLVAAKAAGIRPILILNKQDLEEYNDCWQSLLKWSQYLNLTLVTACAKQGNISELMDHCMGKHSAFVGQSGVGKSTLINSLYPQARARIGELSFHNESGQHTTTHACRYSLNDSSSIMDIPGLQSFGLSHLSLDDLIHVFDEFIPLASSCRFDDCRHNQEPQCAVKQAALDGIILPERLLFWQELSQKQYSTKHYEKNKRYGI
jgi:ribosome biogenesis GTPase